MLRNTKPTHSGTSGSDGVRVTEQNLDNFSDPFYAPWRASKAQLMVLDAELRIVLWSRGMAKAVANLEPKVGSSVILSRTGHQSPAHSLVHHHSPWVRTVSIYCRWEKA